MTELTRRSFIRGLLAAPAIVAAHHIMPVKLWLPEVWGDGVHDDAPGLQAWLNGERIKDYTRGRLVKFEAEGLPRYIVQDGIFQMGHGLKLPGNCFFGNSYFKGNEHFPKDEIMFDATKMSKQHEFAMVGCHLQKT